MGRSAAANFSDVTRKVLMMGYSYRWMRGLDYSVMPDWLLDECDPIQRQLMGDSADIKGYWQPTQKDVPLKTFLETHREGKHAVRGTAKSKTIFAFPAEKATYKLW
jgi:hypothetical protein